MLFSGAKSFLTASTSNDKTKSFRFRMMSIAWLTAMRLSIRVVSLDYIGVMTHTFTTSSL